MSSPSSIDLFAFPDLVQRHIARSFDHISFLKFSLCSKTANRIAESVTIFRKPDCFNVEYAPYCSYAAFQLRCDETRFGITMNEGSFNVWQSVPGGVLAHFEEAVLDVSQLSVFSGMFNNLNKEKAVFKLTAYLQKLFNYESHFILCGYREEIRNIGEIIDAMPSLRAVTYMAHNVSEENYTDLFYNNKCFDLEVGFSDGFCTLTDLDLDTSKIKVKYFTAESARWMKLGHLLDWDFIYIEAHQTTITSTDMNVFLTKWKNGLKKNVRTLHIRLIKPLEVDVILRGLDAELKEETSQKKLERCHYPAITGITIPELKGGYEMRSEDGATARIFFNKCRRYELFQSVTCFFWPPVDY